MTKASPSSTKVSEQKPKSQGNDFVLERDIDFREMKESELTPEIIEACTKALDVDSSEFTNIPV